MGTNIHELLFKEEIYRNMTAGIHVEAAGFLYHSVPFVLIRGFKLFSPAYSKIQIITAGIAKNITRI